MHAPPAPAHRRITIRRTETVLERTHHELIVPDDITDEQAEEWALARERAGELPPASALEHVVIDGAADLTIQGWCSEDPKNASPSRRDFIVAANECPALLALRFTRCDGVTLTLTGLLSAQLTYEWVRGGQDGEHLAAIAEDGPIATTQPSRTGGPTWVARFGRAAAALGGHFATVSVFAECYGLNATLSAGNEEDENLTIGETSPVWIGNEALISARGVQKGTHLDLSTFAITRAEGDYWSLSGDSARYSDVHIHHP